MLLWLGVARRRRRTRRLRRVELPRDRLLAERITRLPLHRRRSQRDRDAMLAALIAGEHEAIVQPQTMGAEAGAERGTRERLVRGSPEVGAVARANGDVLIPVPLDS